MSPLNPSSLRAARLFASLSDPDLAHFAAIAQERSFPKGRTIFDEGDPAAGFFVLLSGEVKIYKLAPDGREQILRIARPGETFAEAAALLGQSFPATAEALSTASTLYFPSDRFRDLLARNPQLSLRMIASLCQLLHSFVNLTEQLAFSEVSARLAKYLLDLAAHQPWTGKPPQTITLDVSKGVLASRLGTVGETLSRSLAKLRDRKIIEVKGRSIRILDPDALELAASGEE